MDEVDVGVSSEFPRIGDKLIVAGAGGPYEAEVRNDHDTGLEWIRYIEGYRVAARATFAVAQADGSNVERVVFPVVFLYRHHCELCLKAIRVIGGALLGLPTEFQAVHYFDKLWPLSLEIIQRRWGGKDPQLIATVRANSTNSVALIREASLTAIPLKRKINPRAAIPMRQLLISGISWMLSNDCAISWKAALTVSGARSVSRRKWADLPGCFGIIFSLRAGRIRLFQPPGQGSHNPPPADYSSLMLGGVEPTPW